MKSITIPILLSLYLMTSLTANAQEPQDSTDTTDLNEIVVEAQLQSASAKLSRYIPTRQVKNASQDAIDLLCRMAIPELSIDPVNATSVTTPSGQPVTIFINYLEADPQNIFGLRTSDVKSVEYLEYPQDPRFKGVRYAINIIVQDYEYGGYTKISDRQFMLYSFSNQASLFSKFAYKKMTYDLYVSTDAVAGHEIKSDSYSIYRLPGGDVVRKSVMDQSDFRYINVPVTFRALYQTSKMTISNTLGFTFMDRYKSHYAGSLSITPSAAGEEYSFSTVNPYINRRLSWQGNYGFYLPKQWSLTLYPSASYDRNSSYSTYSTDIPDAVPLVSNVSENVYAGNLSINGRKRFGSKHSIGLTLTGSISRNDLVYRGNSPYSSIFHTYVFSLSPSYDFSLPNFEVYFSPGLAGYINRTNGYEEKKFTPGAYVYVSYSPNNKNRLAVSANYRSSTADPSQRSTNVIQSDEYNYRTGNPYLSSTLTQIYNLNYTFLPTRVFNLYVFGNLSHENKPLTSVLSLYDDGKALLSKPENNGSFTKIDVGVGLTVRLFSDKLILSANPMFSDYRRTGIYRYHDSFLSCNFGAQYYIGAFNITGYYTTRQRTYSATANSTSYIPHQYGLMAGWSNSDWTVSLFFMNFASYYFPTQTTLSDTPYLYKENTGYNGNYTANLGVTVTYTIGYGKKIQRGDEVGAQSGGASAIL